MAKAKKIQITLNEELLQRIDDIADENYMSRSGLISVATSQYINQLEGMKLVKSMSLAMKKIADTGCIDEEMKSQLEDFERISNLLMGAN